MSRVQNWGSGIDSKYTDVGDGNCSVFHFLGSCLSLSCRCSKNFQLTGELKHRHLIGVFDVRNNESSWCCRSNTKVHKVVNNDLFIGPSGVHSWIATHRPHHRLGHNQKWCHLYSCEICGGLESLDILHGSSCINVNKNRNVRCSKGRLNHSGSDCFSNTLDWNSFLTTRWRRRCC